MVRTARPSDLYRLPEHAQRSSAAPPPPEPGRRFPAWLGVAGVLAAVLVVSGVVGTTEGPAPDAPLVDVVNEDQAIAALSLYRAQAATIRDLRERDNIYAGPGPQNAATAARTGAAEVQTALDQARQTPGPDPLATAYWNAADHVTLIDGLGRVASDASTIALLAATHDSLYGGAGSIPIRDAYRQLTETFPGRHPEPQVRWAQALIEQIEERDRVAEAAQARRDTARLWRQRVAALRPAALPQLQTYVTGLPDTMVQGLRGHPVAGPGLEMLDETTR